MKLSIFFAAAFFLTTCSAPANNAAPAAIGAIAQPGVAQPFSLHDVRLLPGPFLTGQQTAAEYLLSLRADSLLANFRREAGLKPKAPHYGGWESQGVSGHCGGHYLSGCALAYAATGDEEFKQRVNYFVSELAECQAAAKDGYVAAIPGGREVYEQVQRGEITFDGFHINGLWVPNYTLHKQFAGLRDAYRLCGNKQALEVAVKLADWYDGIVAKLSDEQIQTMLGCEHGGLNETFADLYVDTGDERYLKLAQRIYHREVLEPLSKRVDILPGRHANTQIPKLIGLARLYEVAGRTADHDAAEFFWQTVVHHHSYVTGGHCDHEYFAKPDQLNDRLSDDTTETCNVYNMLKLTEHLFAWQPTVETADFYERALLNHIRSSQHPDGRVIYNLTLRQGGTKHYQRKYEDFTCCVGTGMENHVRYGAGIYFHDADSLWVNLFIPSELNWRERGVTVRQETEWPKGQSSTLTIETDKPQIFTLRIRRPHWAAKGMIATVTKASGETIQYVRRGNGYTEISQEWADGDRVQIEFPMTLRTEAMPDNPHRIGIFYGPTLLAADLGASDDPQRDSPNFVPVLVTDGKPVSDWLKTVDRDKLEFRTKAVGRDRDVTLRPFHELHDRSYTVYFDVFNSQQWAERQAEVEAARRAEAELVARTVDEVRVGEQQSEQDHHFAGDQSESGAHEARRWRHAQPGGHFEYQLRVDPTATHELRCTYWGAETGHRVFDLLVNGEKVGRQTLTNENGAKFYDVTYPIPAELTKDKAEITVRFESAENGLAGGIFGVRLLRVQPESALQR